MVQLLHPYMTTWKTVALSRQTFAGKVMSLLFNMLSRLVITFLPRSKHLLISWLESLSAFILEPPQNKVCHCSHCFPICLPWSDRTRIHDLSCLNVEFLAKFFTLFFHFTHPNNLCVHAKLLQSCLTLYKPIDCSLPGSCVNGILLQVKQRITKEIFKYLEFS